MTNVAQKAIELSRAVFELREVCLHSASGWAAEQLKGLGESDECRQGRITGAREARQNSELDPKFLLARQYFEEKEYQKAARCLSGVYGRKSVFLRCYALFIAGQKGREDEMAESHCQLLDQSQVQNAHLVNLEKEICQQLQNHPTEPFLLYVYGLVLSDRQRNEEARAAFVKSVTGYPCNWSGWQALHELCPSLDIVDSLRIPNHWMNNFFFAHLSVELKQPQDGLLRLQQISTVFPTSAFVLSECASTHYNLRNFDISQSLFEDLLEQDPYRLEGIDAYSNILYVKELSAELSHLAHKAMSIDKYRPETCCIVGNYYSLKCLHHKALQYFQRALKLDPKFLSAWTLMGHEYIEIRNYPAAIDAYRRGADMDSKDFQSWYGLGQAYEMMEMPSFALYYFRKAANLQPDDARMWNAMGICYQKESINKPNAAIKCFQRALSAGDLEGISVNFLARLYQKSGQMDEAAHYYELLFKRLDDQHMGGKDMVEALTFLAENYMTSRQYKKAERCCTRLMDLGGPEREKAKQLMRYMGRSFLGQV
ncbi:hypothetical protein BSKO_09839 [Bryopsis sp. KO-2023]|nr:hypothetical protein BSKO_09839 [Bryopsis sp. KO-2023]